MFRRGIVNSQSGVVALRSLSARTTNRTRVMDLHLIPSKVTKKRNFINEPPSLAILYVTIQRRFLFVFCQREASLIKGVQ